MKTFYQQNRLRLFSIIVAISNILFSACGHDGSNLSYTKDVPKQVKFDGQFAGSGNGSNYLLSISNTNGKVDGALRENDNNMLLTGIVSGDRLKGTINMNLLGDVPFEAYYQGPALVVQFDEDTINALKLIVTAISEDLTVLFADNKIVFYQQ